MNDPTPSAFAGIRVLELTDHSAQLCGKLLADLGAEVLKVEPPGGVPVRRVPPFFEDRADPNGALTFWHYNTSKESIVLDLSLEPDRRRLHELARSCDVVVESLGRERREAAGLTYDHVREANPRVVFCSLTPFGDSGPWAGHRATDLVHLALGGVMASCGYDAGLGLPPIAPAGGQSWHVASIFAALAISVALVDRLHTGEGQQIDLAVHDTVSVTTEMSFHYYVYDGEVVKRQSGRHALPHWTAPQTYRTADGHYLNAMLVYLETRRWLTLVGWLDETGEAEDLTDDMYLIPEVLDASMQHVSEVVGRFIAEHDLEFLHRGAQARKLPFTPIRGVEALLDDEHFAVDRELFSWLDHEQSPDPLPYVATPYRFSRSDVRVRRRAPTLDEHPATVDE
jgi:benzylsuccinate CoA-transferase BbsE subunit